MQATSISGPVLMLLAIPTTSASWEIWHRHFGHVGMLGLKLLHDKALAWGFNVDLTSDFFHKCTSCIASKMAWQPFPSVNESRAKEVGEKTHSGIWVHIAYSRSRGPGISSHSLMTTRIV